MDSFIGLVVISSSGATAKVGMQDNSAVVAVLIVERPLCFDCICSKSGVALTEIDAVLKTGLARSSPSSAPSTGAADAGAPDRVYSAFRPK